MVDATGTVLTAVATIAAGGATGLLGGYLQSRAALMNWRRARSDAVHKLAADLIKDVATSIASAGHSACWLTWKAQAAPSAVTDADIQRYDDEMHELLPKILGGQAALSTLCRDAGERVKEAADLISVEDAKIGEACIAFKQGATAQLGLCHECALKAYQRSVELCSGMASDILRRELI